MVLVVRTMIGGKLAQNLKFGRVKLRVLQSMQDTEIWNLVGKFVRLRSLQHQALRSWWSERSRWTSSRSQISPWWSRDSSERDLSFLPSGAHNPVDGSGDHHTVPLLLLFFNDDSAVEASVSHPFRFDVGTAQFAKKREEKLSPDRRAPRLVELRATPACAKLAKADRVTLARPNGICKQSRAIH